MPEHPAPRTASVVAAVALGGGLGALARHAATLAPTAPGAFPWAVLAVNTLGCALIGVLMVAVTEVREAHPLVRPFLGVGVLGGFTTFSAYAADVHALLGAGRVAAGCLYLAATAAAALAATAAGTALARRVLSRGARP
ncbi:Putative fluoride ion transporter CrcB [Nocardiopsis dassonvillei]|uniref:fluoride efflux transporter FluC n=1 Tax=Nocardiopsis dassonvillei TaxID=2014 RepID=UPI003F5623AF